ncbi:hypothetical protein NM208_g761 [Fusarium decemcellulare]|uniref:Uncharacterized protein n=1 Tax=Fusarium decemcellulare TaxID=57161 RepID=A0ACC1SYA4_9HYPO|nr:hypothetical protein NM208_g761 [Fusarium decemcellulare]
MSSSPDNVYTVGSASSFDSPSLQVDFSWKKWKALVSEKNGAGQPATPKYQIEYNTFKSPSMVFHPIDDKSTVIGSGTLHPISIHADYEIHGRKGTLKALRRFVTSYTHLSYNYSDHEDGSPAAMTWTSSSNFKTWDFICLDEKENAVARFSANAWAVTKVGNIEFMGPKAHDPAAREEIMITGLTLFSQMLIRATSILSFFGAIFSRPGPLDKGLADTHARPSFESKEHVQYQEHSFPKGEKA